MASKRQRERTHMSIMDMEQAWKNTIRRQQQFSSEDRFQQHQQPRVILGRSVSFGDNSRFCREPIIPMLKKQSSVVARRVAETGGEFFHSCFGPGRSVSPDSLSSKLMVSAAEKHSSGRWEFAEKPVSHHVAWFPRSRSTTSFMERPGSGNCKIMGRGVMEVGQPKASAAAKDRIVRQGGHWERQDEQSYKPPAQWKLLLRKLRAQAKRSVYPVPSREQWMNYDLQSYRKNFDNGADSQGARSQKCTVSAGAEEKVVHATLLAKFHSTRADGTATAPALLRTGATHIPVRSATESKPQVPAIAMWPRSSIDSPLKLEIR